MKARTWIIAALLIGGFIYFTSSNRWGVRNLFSNTRSPGPVWSEPTTVRGAGLT